MKVKIKVFQKVEYKYKIYVILFINFILERNLRKCFIDIKKYIGIVDYYIKKGRCVKYFCVVVFLGLDLNLKIFIKGFFK